MLLPQLHSPSPMMPITMYEGLRSRHCLLHCWIEWTLGFDLTGNLPGQYEPMNAAQGGLGDVGGRGGGDGGGGEGGGKHAT